MQENKHTLQEYLMDRVCALTDNIVPIRLFGKIDLSCMYSLFYSKFLFNLAFVSSREQQGAVLVTKVKHSEKEQHPFQD